MTKIIKVNDVSTVEFQSVLSVGAKFATVDALPDATSDATSDTTSDATSASIPESISNDSLDGALDIDSDLSRAVFAAQARNAAEKSLPTLTKAELADLLFEQVGLNKREAKDMIETFFKEIRDALERGEAVKLSGFGNFQLRNKPQRPGRNPKTGEEIPISARRVVTFHASQKLKEMVDTVNNAAVALTV